MQRYADYAKIFEQSYYQLSAHTVEELSIGLMYRYESCKGSLESDVEMLVKYCGDKAEAVMQSALKYIRKVYTSHSWQYYNVLFETAWAANRCGHPLRAAKFFRAALILNYREKNDSISGINSYYISDFYDSSEHNMSKPEELIDRNTAYSAGIRKRVLQRHFARAAEAFEAAGFPFEAEALYKRLCDEQLRYGDVFALRYINDLCRLYTRIGMLNLAKAYCGAAEKIVSENRRLDIDILRRTKENKADLLFREGDFRGAYQICHSFRRYSAGLEQHIDLEILFDFVLYLASGERRDSKLSEMQTKLNTPDVNTAVCILKLMLGLNIEKKGLDPKIMDTLKKVESTQGGSYFKGQYCYYYALICAQSEPQKSIQLLAQAERYLAEKHSSQQGWNLPGIMKAQLFKAIIKKKRGVSLGWRKDISGCGVIYEWILLISYIDELIERNHYSDAMNLLPALYGILRAISGISVQLYAAGAFLKRYIAALDGKNMLSEQRKAELTEYMRSLNECVPLFGGQEDFGMSFISSGDSEFLDEYLYELTECDRED